MKITEINEAERAAFLALLDMASDRMGAAGCNDFEIDDTPDGRALIEASETTGGCLGDEPFQAHIYKGKLLTQDFVVLGYLEHLIANAGKQPK